MKKIALFLTLAFFSPLIPAFCATIESSGELVPPPKDVPIMPVSTDPTIQRVLSEDFSVAGRTGESGKPPVTLTVVTSEQVLRPGVSVQQLAPGDPEVRELIAKAGIDVPALGASDLGEAEDNSQNQPASPTTPFDPQQRETMRVEQSFATMMGPYGMPMMGMPGMMGYPGVGGGMPGTFPGQSSTGSNPMAGLIGGFAKQNSQFDRVLVVKAELQNGGKMTFVAIVPPNEDMSAVKQNLAERIAGAILK